MKRPEHSARGGLLVHRRRRRPSSSDIESGQADAGGPSPDAGLRAGRILFLAVLLRPWLWPVALGEMFRLAPSRWWAKWPPLPVPAEPLWRFRMETAYGGAGDSAPSVEDIQSFLAWCREHRTWRKL
jgi:hypothetical protein